MTRLPVATHADDASCWWCATDAELEAARRGDHTRPLRLDVPRDGCPGPAQR